MAHDAPPGTPELDDRTIETAIALDIDPFAEDHLLWIARSALNDTELPHGWHRCTLPDLTEGFANPSGGIEQQEHPRAEEFRAVVAQERRRLAMKAHRPLQETQPRPAKRARPGTTSGDEENVYKENDGHGKGGIDTRIAAMEASHRVALKGNTMYVYGGLYEPEESSEITLNDMWSVDLSKLDGWTCLHAGNAPEDALVRELSDDGSSSDDSSEGEGEEEESGSSDSEDETAGSPS